MKFIPTLMISAILLASHLNGAETEGKGTEEALAARYAAQREALRKSIAQSLPFASKDALDACIKTSRDQEAARAAVAAANTAVNAAKEELKARKNDKEARDQANKSLAEAYKKLTRAKKMLADAKVPAQQALCRIGNDTILSKASVDAFFKAIDGEKLRKQELKTARKALGKVNGARALVGHAKGKWIGGAKQGIAAAEAALKKATTEAERKAAQEKLAGQKKSLEAGLQALKERQANLDKLLLEEPALKKAVEVAEKNLADAKEHALTALSKLGLKTLLSDAGLDNELVTFIVLTEGTPEGLAAFASQGEAQKKLIDQLLSDPQLMKQIVVADSPVGGMYGKAMEIYRAIQQTSPKAKEGMFQRLALAVALQHAVPRSQRNAKTAADAPKTVDPVKRYLAYEKAWLAGELDPAFKNMSTWEYRFVVDGEESDEESQWGRDMLKNYRPDHISNPDYRWRYVGATRTEVRYTRAYRKLDQPELRFYQNIIAHGGICGRRAFFGRFMCRAFGIPTTARPSPGHGALAHWTPDGWVVCLGGGWGAGTTRTRYTRDVDFLANTQARESGEAFLQVKRAQWIGDLFAEDQVYGPESGDASLWYSVSHYVQRQIIKEARAKALAAVGEELGEANESKVKYEVNTVKVTAGDRAITSTDAGVITIPAVACSQPTESTAKILFMPSSLGGKQLHYNRNGKPETFSYKITVPRAGPYKLAARVATTSPKQFLAVAVNGAGEPVTVVLPFTLGMWDTTAPAAIELKKGENTLTFSRTGDDIKGLTIKDFTLAPAN